MSELWGLWGPLPTWDGVKSQFQYPSTDAGSLRACLLGPPVLSQPRRAVPESGQVPSLPGGDHHSPMLLPATPGASPPSPSPPPLVGSTGSALLAAPALRGAGGGRWHRGAVLEPPSPSPSPLSPSPPRPLESMHPLTNLPARSKASVPTPSPREGPGGQGLGGGTPWTGLEAHFWKVDGEGPEPKSAPAAQSSFPPLTSPSHPGREGNQIAGREKAPLTMGSPPDSLQTGPGPTLSLTLPQASTLSSPSAHLTTVRGWPPSSGRPSTGRSQAPAASREERRQLGKGLR